MKPEFELLGSLSLSLSLHVNILKQLLMNSHPHYLRNSEYCKLLFSPPSQQQQIQFATRAAISSDLRLEGTRMKRDFANQRASNLVIDRWIFSSLHAQKGLCFLSIACSMLQTLSSQDQNSHRLFALSFLDGICSSFPDQLSQYFCIHGSFRSLAFLKGVESIGQEEACGLFDNRPSQVKFFNLNRSHPVPYAWITKLLEKNVTGVKGLCEYAWRSELSSERYSFLTE